MMEQTDTSDELERDDLHEGPDAGGIRVIDERAPAPAQSDGAGLPGEPPDAVTERLNVAIRTALGGTRKGAGWTRAGIRKVTSVLTPILVRAIREIAGDEKQLQQLEKGLIRALEKRMSPAQARTVAGFVMIVAKNAAKKPDNDGK